MFDLIERLKEEHRVITASLEEVKSLGIVSQEGQKKLAFVKETLLKHLKLEDEKLYPVLKEIAEAEESLRLTLDIFAKDMDEVSRKVLDFFERYSRGGSGIDFARDFGALYALLSTRIRKEEDVLFVAYNKYKDKKV